MNGKEIQGATIDLDLGGKDITRTAALVYWTDKGIAWLEPGYDNPNMASPTFHFFTGSPILAKENEAGHFVMRTTTSDDRQVRVRVWLTFDRQIQEDIDAWNNHLDEIGTTHNQEWERMALDLDIEGRSI